MNTCLNNLAVIQESYQEAHNAPTSTAYAGAIKRKGGDFSNDQKVKRRRLEIAEVSSKTLLCLKEPSFDPWIIQKKLQEFRRINSAKKVVLCTGFMTGDFKKGVWVERTENEIMYKGGFANNLREGKGILYCNQTVFYVGQFLQNQMNGRGKIYDESGECLYKGEFVNGSVEGKGQIFYKKMLVYEGEFKNNLFHGQGVLHYLNPNQEVRYRGSFKEGLFDGNGALYYRNQEVEYQGFFTKGFPSKAETPQIKAIKIKIHPGNAESSKSDLPKLVGVPTKVDIDNLNQKRNLILTLTKLLDFAMTKNQ